ncbi:MAG TPA: HAD family hydrolase [Verrucomicrobiae bacterium]|jgi:HAD superfamily hydrolase (TIGR01509 family)|nr:HAD family hydrolase [Verrucomicrobiae bacterium]
MIRAVFFDIDGTLMDTNYLHVEAWADAFAKLGVVVPRRDIHRQIGKSGKKMVREFIPDEAKAKKADKLHGKLYKKIQEKGKPLPGACDLIAAMKERGLSIWFATSAKPEELDHTMNELGAHDLIDMIVSSADVEEGKPEPDVFQLTLERARVAPDEAVALGDTIWDIESAERCGIKTAVVLTGGAYGREELEKSGAVAVYRDCAEALKKGFPEKSK